MDTVQQHPPVQSTPATSGAMPSQQPSSTNQTVPPAKEPSSLSPYLLAFLTFLIGIGIGYMLTKYFPGGTQPEKEAEKKQTQEITLPPDAEEVASCVERKGKLFVKPQDIPKGPIYMVYNDKVIGLEYILDQEEFENEAFYSFLPALNINIDHLNVTRLTKNYQGKEGSFNVVDLFLVPKETAEGITCPQTESEAPAEEASPSAALEEETPLEVSVTQGTAVGTTSPQTQPSTSTTPQSQ